MRLLKVLKVPTSRAEHKLIGASLPVRIHAYLTLYSLAKGTTKSKVIKELIEAWITSQREKEPDKTLIEEIIERVNLQWKVEKNTNPGTTFREFKEELKLELEKRGVNDRYVSLILMQMEKDGKD